MRSYYYYLVAGLPDLSAEDKKLAQTIPEYIKEIKESGLSSEDSALFFLFTLPVEHVNLLEWLRNGKEAKLNPEGIYTTEDFLAQDHLEFDEDGSAKGLPPYFIDFIERWKNDEFKNLSEMQAENILISLYYEYAMSCKNEFVSDWFEFELNTLNLETAIVCKNNGINPSDQIVGGNDVSEILGRSSSRDFGVSSVFPNAEQIIKIYDEKNLMEREKKIDLMKWQWLDENTFFHYFTVEKLISQYIKMQCIERWMNLDENVGKELFRKLINDMKNSVEKPAV